MAICFTDNVIIKFRESLKNTDKIDFVGLHKMPP